VVSFELLGLFEDPDLLGFFGGLIAHSHRAKTSDHVRPNDYSRYLRPPAGEGSATWPPCCRTPWPGQQPRRSIRSSRSFHTVSRRPEGGCGIFQRLGTRQQDRDLPATQETIVAQVTALPSGAWRLSPPRWPASQHPVLVGERRHRRDGAIDQFCGASAQAATLSAKHFS